MKTIFSDVLEKGKMRNVFLFLVCPAIIVLITAAIFRLDEKIYTTITAMQSPILNVLMVGVTDIAEIYLGIIVIFIMIIAARQKRLFWDMAVAMLIDIVIILLLKTVIARPRPEMSNVLSPMLSSFPSGHASRAFVMFGTMGKYWKRYKWPLYGLATLIAFSRLYLGVHYASDVVFGSLLGILISEITVHFKLGEKLEKGVKKIWHIFKN